MKCEILHESKGRMRVHAMQKRMTLKQADLLEYYMRNVEGVVDVKVYERTCNTVIKYNTERSKIITALAEFGYSIAEFQNLVPEQTTRELNRQYEEKLVSTVMGRYLRRIFLPTPLRYGYAIYRAAGYLIKGLKCLAKGKIEVPVLDAAAITVSMLRGDFKTASSVMFLLRIGEILEEWTHKKSVGDLARLMSLNVDKVWLKTQNRETLVPLTDVKIGDEIVVRTGNMIPLDGKVVFGDATVNQASITGESIPVHKETGSYVYAGTVLEEGYCVICVDKNSGSGRYDRIVKMIEESEKLKSDTEDKASHLADKLVPYTLLGTILTYLLTRNTTKALSVLMVDFSCALKLAMPISVLSAMRESSFYNISVKGGRFLETVAEADTVVFDKTGTLTHATPKVADIITFGNHDKDEMLRLAACLEEHYPHSMANAVVKAALEKELNHEERHSKVEYVVAHGISSTVDNQKVIIGSYHFVFQDENCIIPDTESDKFNALPDNYSHLYLAISGVLAAVICIEDTLREEANAVINSLHKLGFGKIVMMTGDNAKTAHAVANEVGVDEYYAEVLPEDKADFIKNEHKAGRKVIMIGDGVNDSPALSEADAGIAISNGAAIAREIADITISADDLFALVTLKSIANALMKRIKNNYNSIVSFNLMLIILGVTGVIQPTSSAFLHNISTLIISLQSMTDLLE